MVSLPRWPAPSLGYFWSNSGEEAREYLRLLESRLTYIAELVPLSAEVFFKRL